MKRQIIIAGVWGAGNISIVEQMGQDKEITFLKDDFRYALQLRKVWRVINRRLGGRGRGILRGILKTRFFDAKYALSHCDFDSHDENDVVIFNSALLHYYSAAYFKRLKKRHPSIRYILYIIDPMPDGLWREVQEVLPAFDHVMTMHPFNCRKYGFQYLPYAYAKPTQKAQIPDIPETELFYCGVLDDHRLILMRKMVKQCEKRRIAFDFWFKPYQDNPMHNAHVHYGLIPYEENVQRLRKAKCILEVMHKGYVGITQRYLEAVIYNKRLLSNNREITELPYYNPRFMQYFEKIEDIDWEWLHSEEEVDYHYQGDFSVEAWKKNLVELLEELNNSERGF
jgi:hypothetical protein